MQRIHVYAVLCALLYAGFVSGAEDDPPPSTPSPTEREETLGRYYTDSVIRSAASDDLQVRKIS
jgi:hypothetical protein